MGRGVKIPFIGVKIPCIGVKIPWVGVGYTMGKTVKIPCIGGSKYHG
jgi:hypothetical protein